MLQTSYKNKKQKNSSNFLLLLPLYSLSTTLALPVIFLNIDGFSEWPLLSVIIPASTSCSSEIQWKSTKKPISEDVAESDQIATHKGEGTKS